MGVRATWDNQEKTVLLFAFDGQWTWDDYYRAREEAHVLMCSVAHRVDVIALMQHSTTITVTPKVLLEFQRAIAFAPKNWGAVVLVGSSSGVQVFYNTVNRLYRHLSNRLMLAETLDEARALLGRAPAVAARAAYTSPRRVTAWTR